MTKMVEVKILGRNFSFDLPREVHPREFMEIVAYVEDRIRSIRGQSIDMDSFRLGLLTSINIAAEFFSIRRENDDLRAVLRRIDEVIAGLDEEEKKPRRRTQRPGSLRTPLVK